MPQARTVPHTVLHKMDLEWALHIHYPPLQLQVACPRMEWLVLPKPLFQEDQE